MLLSKAQSLDLYNPSTPLVYDYCQHSWPNEYEPLASANEVDRTKWVFFYF
jgi:hypothetical protein